jgi:HD-like signal output (HDOD) protein
MGQQTIQSLIEESFETDSEALPVFSPIALQLQRLKSREDSSMAQVTALIMKDQSLAGRVLQVANSSFCGGLKKVETVRHAVVRWGSSGWPSSLCWRHRLRPTRRAIHSEAVWKK